MKSVKVRAHAIIRNIKYPINRKPVEKQGPKVKGLQLLERNQDRQIAEDKKESPFTGLVSSRLVLFEPYKKAVPINRKSAKRQGRKAMGLKPQTAMTARLPKTSYQDSKRLSAKDLDAQKDFL